MSYLGIQIKGRTTVQDNKKEWVKIDGVCIGESSKFGYKTGMSRDIGALLDKLISDPQAIAVVYNWKAGIGYIKSGLEPNNESDSKLDDNYTSFIKNNVTLPPTVPVEMTVTPSGFLGTKDGELTLDGERFVSVGSNAYWLGYTEEGNYPTKEQQEEMFIAVTRMKGNTIRSHTLGHSSGGVNSLRPRGNTLNENAWESIDYAFSLAKKYNVKIVAPLTDAYFWYNGNYGHYCQDRGVPKADFWTNREVISDFKDYIYKYLHHFNKYNNCMMKDDPSLGIIELGNELGNIRENHGSVNIPTNAWLNEISDYVKSIDNKHLILNPADECLGQSDDFNVRNLDCHGAHFYWEDFGRLDYGINMTKRANKPYILGEYSSFSNRNWFNTLENKKVNASLFWSMYPHTNGIFGGDRIPHEDGYTIHYDEGHRNQLIEITNHFCRLRGLPPVDTLDFGKYVPVINIPVTPVVTQPSAPVEVPTSTPVVTQPSAPVIQSPAVPENVLAWGPGVLYKRGDTVFFGNEVYTCLNEHNSIVSWEPNVAFSLWKIPPVSPVDGSTWKPNSLYKLGNVVIYSGASYTCLNEHTSIVSWEPTVAHSLWKLTGQSEVTTPVVTTPVVTTPVVTTPVVTTPSINFGGRLARLLNGKPPIGTYYQSWSAGWSATGANHDLAKITAPINIVYLSFVQPNCTYTKGSNNLSGTGLSFSSDFNVIKDAVQILRNKGIIVMLSVGGATFPFTTYNANNVADLSNDLGCNGIDIDWEDEHGFYRFGGFISATRRALPDGCVSTAAFSVGAYGEGSFVNSPPGSSRTGMNISGLKSNGSELDWINIMSYDASNAFNPIESFNAYKSFYNGPLLIGGEVPPEAWGGHVIDLEQVKSECEFLKTQGPGHGYFTWSHQKQGSPNSNQILKVASDILNTQSTVVTQPAVVVTQPAIASPIDTGKTILAPYTYSWSKWHPNSYKIPTLVEGYKKIGLSAATFAFVTSDGAQNLSATVQENIQDMIDYVKLGGHLIISCGGAMSPWIETTMSVDRMVTLLTDLIKRTGAKGLDLDVEGTALHNTADVDKLNKAVSQVQKNIPGLYVSYTIPVGDPKWESIEAPSQALLRNAVLNGVSVNVVNMMLMDLYGDYTKRPRWGDLAIQICENAKNTLKSIFSDRNDAQIYRTMGLCPMIGRMDDFSVFEVEDARILARYAKEKNVGLYSGWAINRDQVGDVDLNLHSRVNKVDFEFYNAIKEILFS